MANTVTVAPIVTANALNAVVKVTVNGQFGNSFSAGLDETDRAVLISDLIQTLPSDHHLRKYLHI